MTVATPVSDRSAPLVRLNGTKLRIAVVHEWLDKYAGSERVLEQMIRVLPEADLFSIVDFVPESERGFLQGRLVRTSFIQRIPFVRKLFRNLLALMPLAVEALDLSGYDLVVSSSHALAKGVITGPDQIHICYCYSPMRYAWDLNQQYLAESGMSRGLKGALARLVLHYMRLWDLRTANGVDQFIGISGYIARRIRKVYRREAIVIYPPVDVEAFELQETKEDFYLTAGRLVPYKKVSAIVAAFAAMPDKRLVIIGDGPLYDSIRSAATPNVEVLGYQPFKVLRDHMQRARAFLFAAEEDFGITVVEAQACGTPVICYGRGGATETIIDGTTGLFFSEQTPESIHEAIERFESLPGFSPTLARQNAERFSGERFRLEFLEVVRERVRDFTV